MPPIGMRGAFSPVTRIISRLDFASVGMIAAPLPLLWRRSDAVALGTAGWLGLAAAPTFAVMALLTGLLGGGVQAMPCMGAHDASPLSGMTLMYLLMSAFHSARWLKLISGRRSSAGRSWSGVRQIEFKSPCRAARRSPRSQ